MRLLRLNYGIFLCAGLFGSVKDDAVEGTLMELVKISLRRYILALSAEKNGREICLNQLLRNSFFRLTSAKSIK